MRTPQARVLVLNTVNKDMKVVYEIENFGSFKMAVKRLINE